MDDAEVSPVDAAPTRPVLLSLRDTAKLFNRTKRTIQNWIAAGLLHPVRVGRSVFIRQDEIQNILNGVSNR